MRADVDLGSARVEHQAGELTLRNRTLFGDYDRAYQNYVPGAVTPSQTLVALTAYNNATRPRRTCSTRPTLIYSLDHGPREAHAARPGSSSAGRSPTTSATPASSTTRRRRSRCPSRARPSRRRSRSARARPTPTTTSTRTSPRPTCRTSSSSRPRVQLVAGLRFDRFDLTYHNNRNGDTLDRVGQPRLAARRASSCKPVAGGLALRQLQRSYLPSSGDQFSSLTDDHPAAQAGEVHELRAGGQVGRRTRASR